MELEPLVKLIGQVGFPIAVAAFVLWRMDQSMRALREEMVRLLQAVERVLEKLS